MAKVKMTKEEREAYKQTDLYKYKSARLKQYGFGLASWVTMILPDGILLGVNWNEWVTTQLDTIKVATGLIITVLVMVFMLYKKLTKEIKFSYLGLVVGMWVAVGVCYLLSSLLTQMLLILVCAAIGMTSSMLLDIPEEYYKAEKQKYYQNLVVEGKVNKKFGDFIKATKKVFGSKKEEKTEREHNPVE